MTTGNGTSSSDRLDRAEAILVALAESQAIDRRNFDERLAAMDERLAATQAIVDSNARAIEANSAAAIADRRNFDERLAATQAIVDSNARAIAANSIAIADQRAAQAANEQTITNAVLGMLDMGEGIMVRIDDLGRRMDQQNRRIEDLYRAQGHILRRLFGENSTDSESDFD